MFLSIIVPVYNLETYIEKCIQSCLNQDIDDYEIILINDGSKDKSADILDLYTIQYPDRIKVFHKENGGVSSARNLGIKKAQGDWIWFVDGDDWIATNCLKSMCAHIKSGKYDFLRFGAEVTYDSSHLIEYRDSTEVAEVNGKSLFESPLNNGSCDAMWNYWLLREKIINNNISFDTSMKYAEDINFVIKYKSLCSSGLVIAPLVYMYYQRTTSAMHSINHDNHLICMRNLYETCTKCAEMLAGDSKQGFYLDDRTTYVKMYLWDIMLYGKNYKFIKNELKMLISQGAYPYKANKRESINGRNKKEKFAQFMQKWIFPHKFLYLLACRVRTILKPKG